MKMAKATKQDIDAALELMGILECVDNGYYPDLDDEKESALEFFNEANKTHLAAFYARVMACVAKSPGGINRVIGGMHTIMHNNILDPDVDVLALHPRLFTAQPK